MKGHVSFKTTAGDVGLGMFWQLGSKHPMITAMLSRTLESMSRAAAQRIFNSALAYEESVS